MSKKDDYTVGYGRPPAEYEFRKGVSGNPHGRPPRGGGAEESSTKQLASAFTKASRIKVPIKENGRSRKITTLDAVARRITQAALMGCIKSQALFLKYMASIGGQLPDPSDNTIRIINAFDYDQDDEPEPVAIDLVGDGGDAGSER